MQVIIKIEQLYSMQWSNIYAFLLSETEPILLYEP